MISYDRLEALAAQAESNGGYLHGSDSEAGDTVEIDGTKLEGRDAFHLLQHMLRRSQAREAQLLGLDGYEEVERDQARRDARREVLSAVTKALEDFS